MKCTSLQVSFLDARALHLTHAILCSILPCFPLSMDKNNVLLWLAKPHSLCGIHIRMTTKVFSDFWGFFWQMFEPKGNYGALNLQLASEVKVAMGKLHAFLAPPGAQRRP